MKKFLLMVVVLMTAFSFLACGNYEESPPVSGIESEQITEAVELQTVDLQGKDNLLPMTEQEKEESR